MSKKMYYAVYDIYDSHFTYDKAWYKSASKQEVINKIGNQHHNCYLVEVKENKKGNKLVIKSTFSDALRYKKEKRKKCINHKSDKSNIDLFY